MTGYELNIWKGRIDRARGIQQKQHPQWRNSLDLYNCVYFDKTFKGFDFERVDVHFANWYIDTCEALYYFRDPFIFVKPTHSKYSGFAETQETVINNLWKRLHLKQQFKRVIKSSLLMPPGWIKLGYTAKIGQDVAKQEEIKQKGIISDIKDAIIGIFKKKEPLTPEEQGELDEYIQEESIFANWIPSWNILMPEGYQLVSQMPYLIEVQDIPKIDFMANPLYKNKDKVHSSRYISETDTGDKKIRKPTYNNDGSISSDTDSDVSIIRLYHVWDRRQQKRFTMSMESSDTHFEAVWPYDMEGFPYKPLIFDESLPSDTESNPYPVNVLQSILPQIIEQSQLRTQMSKWRKRASAIILAQKGLLTEEDMKQLEDTEAVQICYVSNIAAFQMSQIPNLPSGVFDIDEVIKQDLQMGTNMGQMMFQAQPGQRTATQAQIGQSGLQLKSSARVDTVEDLTVEVAVSMAQLAWQFYDRDKISEIVGQPITEDMWPDLPDDPKERKRIIQSELQFRIDAGSTAPPKDETVDRKQLIDALSLAASIAPERIRKDEALKQLFNKFKFDKMEKIVISGDEDEIIAAQEENKLLSANVPQVVGPNENHIIHVQQHQAGIPQPTEASDIHITEHGLKGNIDVGQAGVSNKPQKGDIRPPMKSTNPEMTRKGAPTQGGEMQAAQNLGIGSGQDAS